ncbi:MAG TPA: SDR family oxidoreductase [Flavilitoribacter sp.]|nr:SDR family oxidoreductase [Flavilitoribacter sp.]HMQ86064.1 SDR family oxidoreductase [Flavilitoribacter sp.]
MDLNLKNKNALVCGSSKGIGKAAAIELARLGANVTLVARTAAILSDMVQSLDTTKGQRHDFLQADFTHSADLKKKIKGLTLQKPIHILVNNTGGPPGGPITEALTSQFEQAFHNHLICSHLLTQSVLPGMKNAGYGRIINIISTSVKQPIDGLGVSNTVRAAMANWAKTLATEVGPFGITVNNVLPGFTKTDRLTEIIQARADRTGEPKEAIIASMVSEVPAGRFAAPAEVGGVIAFLAAPAAAYISGTNIVIDGGRTKSL